MYYKIQVACVSKSTRSDRPIYKSTSKFSCNTIMMWFTRMHSTNKIYKYAKNKTMSEFHENLKVVIKHYKNVFNEKKKVGNSKVI